MNACHSKQLHSSSSRTNASILTKIQQISSKSNLFYSFEKRSELRKHHKSHLILQMGLSGKNQSKAESFDITDEYTQQIASHSRTKINNTVIKKEINGNNTKKSKSNSKSTVHRSPFSATTKTEIIVINKSKTKY